MKTQKTFLRYFIEFIVILSGVSASFWVEEYRESLQNEEEMYKVLNNLKIELDEIDVYSKEREIVFNKDSDIIRLLTNNQSNSLDSISLLVETTFEIEVAIIDYRGFRPPMDRYNSIINEGTLKFVKSDKIKKLLSQLNNTFYYYIRANVDDEKIIQQKISNYLIENYPEIIEKWKQRQDPSFPDGESQNDVLTNLSPMIEVRKLFILLIYMAIKQKKQKI